MAHLLASPISHAGSGFAKFFFSTRNSDTIDANPLDYQEIVIERTVLQLAATLQRFA
jgi:hypothetical protein